MNLFVGIPLTSLDMDLWNVTGNQVYTFTQQDFKDRIPQVNDRTSRTGYPR